ncbi:unnamed protein product, partial [Polarella glacialis]
MEPVARVQLSPGQRLEVLALPEPDDDKATPSRGSRAASAERRHFAPAPRLPQGASPPAEPRQLPVPYSSAGAEDWDDSSEREWQRGEITSLQREVKLLKQRKDGLESQIRNSEDANASVQSCSWSILSRVSTSVGSGNSFTLSSPPLAEPEDLDPDSSWLDDRQRLLDKVTELEALNRRLEMDRMQVNVAQAQSAGEEGTKVLASSRELLETERRSLAQQLLESKASLDASEQHCAELSAQLLGAERQASDLAGPVAELQTVLAATAARKASLDALERGAQRADRALSNLSSDHDCLTEVDRRNRQELVELRQALPRASAQHCETGLEVEAAREALVGAQKRWAAEARNWQAALEAHEAQVAKLMARRESASLVLAEKRQ